MINRRRRQVCECGASALLAVFLPHALASDAKPNGPDDDLELSRLRITWIDDWMRTKALVGPLFLSRFRDDMYMVAKEIGWKPLPEQGIYPAVQVPTGFVTDLTSVPRPFWTLLPRDGDYVYAAIIHDYLYWSQTTTRLQADDVLRFAMQDLKINPVTIMAIYQAVRAGGESSWNTNKRLKKNGEKRLLKVFPSDPTVRW